MGCSLFFVLVACLSMASNVLSGDCIDDNTFPNGFKIGVATAAYQIEGAWNESGKGENVWDYFTHTQPWKIVDGSNGDIACDSYHKYKEDVKLLRDIGFDYYRISVSWSRILPNGYANEINEDGLRYYHNLIDELKKCNIETWMTLYHWDQPQVFEDHGGWTNELMVDWFGDYAYIIFREFASKVKTFLTINEPTSFCELGYGKGVLAPGKQLNLSGAYACGHNVLKAHAKAFHIYDEEFRPIHNGKIGIVLSCNGQKAKNPGDEDAVDVSFQFTCGWFAHPIFSRTGDYPKVMISKVAEHSADIGLNRSMLPKLEPEWISFIRRSSDFFGLNHYTTWRVKINTDAAYMPSGIEKSFDPASPQAASKWLQVTPFGFRDTLRKIKDEYGNPEVRVTENGYSDTGTLHDHQRINYYHTYMKEMLLAINRDGCNIQSYTSWSLLDNYEWLRGYTEKFGLVHIDFDSPNRTRTPKLSAAWFKNVLRNRSLNVTGYWI